MKIMRHGIYINCGTSALKFFLPWRSQQIKQVLGLQYKTEFKME